jgi:hypothetical protein
MNDMSFAHPLSIANFLTSNCWSWAKARLRPFYFY